ncbi:hypothetical protein K505DRAFT_323730 [Melanomma pulvis-pyrius CBS 109.77]|uniref:Bacteriophage T5 Orf172 DNA-binding domain-containing protein n=1 Tax=Melanomma pulvis-pyrius CBS 109.77 TaxID=1314802 RepID=A0A6A6XHC7_9PLEO|nr:hypothetical protein K505DRAFT_323730 [Melanomma pulvis-pyrius CBS 109.77]
MASTSSPEFGRIPRRFASPTPSATSDVCEVARDPTPITRAPVDQTETPVRFTGNYSIDYTAPASIRQTPIFSETRSVRGSPQGQVHQQRRRSSGFASSSSHSTPESRPPVKRSTVSDPRFDRSRKRHRQNYGSPTQVSRRRRHQPPTSPSNSDATPEQCSQPEAFLRNATSLPNLAGNQPSAKSKTTQEVHNGLRAKMCKKFTPNNTKGVIYIFRNRDAPHLLKIGSSRNCTQRKQQLERDCNIKLDVIDTSDELQNYLRAEHLAHSDLLHLQREYICLKCGANHTEWYEVSEDLAIKTVKRWVKFMQKEQPYNGRGELKGIWKYLMHKRRPAIPHVNNFDHDYRWDSWTSIIQSPSRLDYFEYIFTPLLAHPIWWFLWDDIWQVSCVSSWLVIFLVKSNYFTLGVLSFSVFCTCIHISDKRKSA